MKIIGKVSDSSYIVEMSPDEIARSAGFESAWGAKWWEMVGQREGIRVGTVIQCNAAFTYHQRIRENQAAAASAANTLRALADLIGGALPEVVIPPIEAKTEGGDA
jgi:hypothetical protein